MAKNLWPIFNKYNLSFMHEAMPSKTVTNFSAIFHGEQTWQKIQSLFENVSSNNSPSFISEVFAVRKRRTTDIKF